MSQVMLVQVSAITGFPSILNGIIHNANAVTTQAEADLKNLIAQIKNTATKFIPCSAFGKIESETLTQEFML
jgi:hypothetical protein